MGKYFRATWWNNCLAAAIQEGNHKNWRKCLESLCSARVAPAQTELCSFPSPCHPHTARGWLFLSPGVLEHWNPAPVSIAFCQKGQKTNQECDLLRHFSVSNTSGHKEQNIWGITWHNEMRRITKKRSNYQGVWLLRGMQAEPQPRTLQLSTQASLGASSEETQPLHRAALLLLSYWWPLRVAQRHFWAWS